MNSEKETSIKKLQKKLYSTQGFVSDMERKKLSKDTIKVSSDWTEEVSKKTEIQEDEVKVPKKKLTGFTILLMFSFIFFVLSLFAALLIFSSGQNKVQYNRVELSILGPNSVAGGEPFTFDVNVANDNQVDIVETDIIITYPEGSYSASLDEGAFEQETRQVEEVIAGTQDTQKFSVILFGQEGDVKDIKVTYEYRVPGNNNLFYKERIYQVKLDSAPISVEVEHPSEALSGSEVEFSFSVISNSNKTIEDVYVQVEYPFGFEVTEVDPKPEVGTTDLYSIGDLGAGESRTIKLIGKISGQDDESRVFKYKVGLLDTDLQTMKFVIASTDSIVKIQSPPVRFFAAVNGKTSSVHTRAGGEVAPLSIKLTNNLATPILDAQITATILGQGFDRRNVRTDGFYDTNINQVLWQKTNLPDLASIEPGETVDANLGIGLFLEKDLAGLVIDPYTKISFTVVGQTFDFQNQKKEISSTYETTIKTETILTLDGAVLHSTGPFENSGSMRPTVGKESQYTVLWRLKNTTSLVEDAKVTAVLPLYVTYVEGQQVEGATITYDQRTRTVTWTVDQVQAGAGFNKSAPQIAFKISVLPSLSQVGREVTFTTEKTLSGVDSYSKQAIKESVDVGETSLQLRQDPAYIPNSEFVTEDSSLLETATSTE